MQELKIINENKDISTIFVNPDNVVSVEEDASMKKALNEGRLPESLQSNHRFSRVSIDSGNASRQVTAIGSPEAIKVKLDGRNILHG